MRLVVQSRGIRVVHLTHLHRLIGSSTQFMQIGEHAYYLPVHTAAIDPAIATFCTQEKIDYALVPDQQRLSQFGLCVMDMDSTLITIECIDEIADMMQIKPQVAAITEATMRGELDFASSLKKRVALLKGLPETALQQVIETRLMFSPGAHEWVAACKAHQIKTMVVSGGFTYFADYVQATLGLDYAVSNQLEIVDGLLTGHIVGDIVDAARKADELLAHRYQLGLTPAQTIAIGDGANDLTMMAAAGASIAYHAKPVVQAQADYALNHVGLDGAIYLFSAQAPNNPTV